VSRLALHDGNRRWWTLGAMCFALFMIMLDNTVVIVALPSIQRSLHATASTLEWTVNAYTLSFALSRGLVVASSLALAGAVVAAVLVAGRPASALASADAQGPASAATQAAAVGAEAPAPGPQPVGV
jgi:MFS family permease